ncbi:MAG: penicillin-binding protein activator [Pseudomonadota bacterium]
MKILKVISCLIIISILLLSCHPKRISYKGRQQDAGTLKLGLYLTSKKAFEEGKFEEAKSVLKDYLRFFPHSSDVPHIYYMLGEIYYKQKNCEEAIKYYYTLVKRHSDYEKVNVSNLRLATCYFNASEEESSLKFLNAIDMRKLSAPEQYEYLTLYPSLLFTYEDYYNAFDLFIASMKVETNSEKIMDIEEKIYFIINELSIAELEEKYKDYKGNFPSADILAELIKRLFAEKQYEKLMDYADDFIDLFPNHPLTAQIEKKIDIIKKLNKVDPHKIGLLLPLSGKNEKHGKSLFYGILLAAKVFSDTGVDISFEVEDIGESDDSEVINQFESLVLDKSVIAVIGPFGVDNLEELAKLANQYEVPTFTFTSIENITKEREYVFRNFLTKKNQVATLIPHLMENYDIKKYAILYPEDESGLEFVDIFVKELKKYNGELVGIEAYEPNSTDFKQPLKKLVGLYYKKDRHDQICTEEELARKKAKEQELKKTLEEAKETEKHNEEENQILLGGIGLVEGEETQQNQEKVKDDLCYESYNDLPAIVDFEAIFIPEKYQTASLIIPALYYHDIRDVVFVGTPSWNNQKFIFRSGKKNVDNSFFVELFKLDESDPIRKRFIDEYRLSTFDDPGYLSHIGYETAWVLTRILTLKDIDKREELKDVLLNLKKFKSIMGNTRITEDGDFERDLTILTVQNGQILRASEVAEESINAEE